ncbi:hypothetical protein HanIR_Chr12g0588471 [Helianthus annuus]|nr:hypothetical protein HanIR_Chr12g0588471 [Helianthus annuus]
MQLVCFLEDNSLKNHFSSSRRSCPTSSHTSSTSSKHKTLKTLVPFSTPQPTSPVPPPPAAATPSTTVSSRPHAPLHPSSSRSTSPAAVRHRQFWLQVAAAAVCSLQHRTQFRLLLPHPLLDHYHTSMFLFLCI